MDILIMAFVIIFLISSLLLSGVLSIDGKEDYCGWKRNNRSNSNSTAKKKGQYTTRDEYVHELAAKCSEEDILFQIEKEIIFKHNKENDKMKSECVCKTTDLLKDYVILHERINALYKILETNRRIQWCWIDSSRTKKKLHYKGLLYGVSLNIKKLGLIKCTEDMDNISVKNKYIREVKNEIKRYHRLQSNIQNVLNTVKELPYFVSIRRHYNTEEVPSQFKNNMNYTYCISCYINY